MWISLGPSRLWLQKSSHQQPQDRFPWLLPLPCPCTTAPWSISSHFCGSPRVGSYIGSCTSLGPSAVATGASLLSPWLVLPPLPCPCPWEGSGVVEGRAGPAWPPRVSLGPELCRPEKAPLLCITLGPHSLSSHRDPHEKSAFISACRICFLSSRTQAQVSKAGLRMRLDLPRFPHCLLLSFLFVLRPFEFHAPELANKYCCIRCSGCVWILVMCVLYAYECGEGRLGLPYLEI